MLNVVGAELGKLLAYPGPGYIENLKDAKGKMEEYLSPGSLKDLETFISKIESEKIGRLEEMYTATYDIHGVCCLDIGYVLFGEDYKRGEFLVNINRLQRGNNVDVGSELGDHLPNVLQLISVMTDEEERQNLIDKIILEALETMNEKFSYSSDNFFSLPMKVILETIKQYKSAKTGLTGVFPC